MNAYIYQAALYCEACALDLRAQLQAWTGPLDRDESDRYPVGPYDDGGARRTRRSIATTATPFSKTP